MNQFRIVIEDTVTTLRAKVFNAETMDEARYLAESDPTWTDKDGWEEENGGDSSCEIREDLSYELSQPNNYEEDHGSKR